MRQFLFQLFCSVVPGNAEYEEVTHCRTFGLQS